jgi:2-hydroxychromene-2-carboxylate isomerase
MDSKETAMDDKAPIDFWFDFSSPYAYLLSERIDDLAARFGRKVRWHPILLGVIFKATGSAPLTLQFPAKAAYWLLDFERSARFMGIPYRHPDVFPLATHQAARAYYWLHGQDCGLARRFAHAVFRAIYVDNRNVSEADVLADIASSLGIARSALDAATQDPAIKERLKAEVDQAIAAGVFGAPYVVIDGQPFFGADRLPQIEKWLESGGF